MPIITVTVPAFPFVPVATGVPAIARAAIDAQAPALLQQAISGVTPPLLTQMLNGGVPSMLNGYVNASFSSLLGAVSPGPADIGDSVSSTSQNPGPQWGIFNADNSLAITPDSVVSVDWSGDFRISNYPIEDGDFQSYNKVRVPFEARITMRKAGTVSDRQDFIAAIEQIRASLSLYTLTTPEKSYASVNVVSVSYERKADRGAAVIEADFHLQEVMTTATATFSNTQQPQAQDPQNGGTVQTQTPNSTQTANASTVPF